MNGSQALTSAGLTIEGRARRSLHVSPPAITGTLIALAAWYLLDTVSLRQAMLFLVGAAAGLVLYHAAFGFTSSWRVFIADRRGAGLRAQLLMLALTCAVFFPLLASGTVLGQPIRGSLAPVGVSVIAGAFLFGVGMQLGGGCASGTLFTVGGGNTRMIATLAAFIAGSLIGTAHAPWWNRTPAFAPTTLVTVLGPWGGLAFCLAIFGAIGRLVTRAERKRHGQVVDDRPVASSWLRGPWPLAAGAVGLALVNISTLVISGRPWGVTSAFALWGAKAYAALGGDVATWPYWSAPAQSAALKAAVRTDITSVMDVGIMLGAMLAATLAGRFAPTWKVSPRQLAASVIGGLCLGYGARIAYGCNIGAFFSGIASGSLHGWLWFVAAFAGNVVGTNFRPWFGLKVERPHTLALPLDQAGAKVH